MNFWPPKAVCEIFIEIAIPQIMSRGIIVKLQIGFKRHLFIKVTELYLLTFLASMEQSPANKGHNVLHVIYRFDRLRTC